jgi:hypothetical protein
MEPGGPHRREEPPEGGGPGNARRVWPAGTRRAHHIGQNIHSCSVTGLTHERDDGANEWADHVFNRLAIGLYGASEPSDRPSLWET